jgi:hypothetical protein
MREMINTYKILVGNVTGGYHLGDTNVGWMILLEMFFKKCDALLYPLSKAVMIFLVSYMARKFFWQLN